MKDSGYVYTMADKIYIIFRRLKIKRPAIAGRFVLGLILFNAITFSQVFFTLLLSMIMLASIL
jgi:hypothetical protein